jgi:hypothetical protein
MKNFSFKLYNKKCLFSGTYYSLLLISLALLITFNSAYASSNDRNRGQGGSIVGNYADGYDLGKENGADDYQSGRSHNSQCPPNDSLSWCTGYKIGYEVGWAAAAALGN